MSDTQRWYATGRRKEATARVWIELGEGKTVVNKRPIDVFFGRATTRMLALQPLEVADKLESIDVLCSVKGGGMTGQAGAIRLGIARALVEMEPELRPMLKKAGFLTRDAREVERKKPGQPGARKHFQFSKR